jgi:hypothetical protein
MTPQEWAFDAQRSRDDEMNVLPVSQMSNLPLRGPIGRDAKI